MVAWSSTECPATNGDVSVLSLLHGEFDDRKKGWAIAGGLALAATLISLLSLFMQARNYFRAKEQRQVMRIVMLPSIVSIISFLSFRFWRTYTYYSLVQILYSSLALAAFLVLLLQLIADASGVEKTVVLARRRKLPFPFSFVGYKPKKSRSLTVLKWSVLQFAIIQPAIAITGVVTNVFQLYCPTVYSYHFASLYLDAAALLSVTIALLGLVALYTLVGELLEGSQPKAKFFGVSGILAVTIYQPFLFSVLAQYKLIKPDKYWATAEHLQALVLCAEMVLFSLLHLYAYSWRAYSALRPPTTPRTPVFRSLLDSANYIDLFLPIYRTPSTPGLSIVHAFGRALPPSSPDFRTSIDSAFSMHDSEGEKPLPEPSLKRSFSWGGRSDGSSPVPNESRIPVEAFLGVNRRGSGKGWNTFSNTTAAGAGGMRRRESYAANADEPYGRGSISATGAEEAQSSTEAGGCAVREKEQVIHILAPHERVEEVDEEEQESGSEKGSPPPATPEKGEWEGRRDYIG